jgi:hypothetical protein
MLTMSFKKLGDLVVDATLINKVSSEFDFNNNEAVTISKTLPIKLIPISKIKSSSKSNLLTQQVMIKSDLILDMSAFDKLTISNVEWTLGTLINSNGYIVTVDISREV